ncbi:MAG TPA: endonuclease VII domain-containing protein [Actinomycetota bacterium]|nr:endonuclease VII domain-containing protein [Actinomycetota bacterium]
MRCARCKREKPPEEFPRNRRTTSGRHCYCKPCHNRQVRESVARAGGSRKYHMKRRYGLTPEDFDSLLAAQGFLCPICLKRPAVHVDHDHRTGKVRGILCEMCNGGLGQFRDNRQTIEAAIDYLQAQSERDR